MDKIFEPFFTTKEKGKGTGLGLSTIFGFMKQSGGHVSVYSEPGHGTTFRLFIPAAGGADEGAAAVAEKPVSASGSRHNATLLVVEDDDGVRDIAVSKLADVGYRILEACNGPAGLQTFVDHPEIELVFSDVIMPGGMTGPEMMELIRKQRPDIPVLFASGYAEHALRERSGWLEQCRFIAKPYDVSELLATVETLLEEAQR